MNVLKNINYDYSNLLNQFENITCPTPDFEAIANVAYSEDDFSEVVLYATEQLCSGLYFLGLLLKNSTPQKDYFCNSDDIEQFLVKDTSVLVVNGNLTIEGDLYLDYPLLVTGNLIVNGICKDSEDNFLAVCGSFKTDGFRTTGWVIVGGDTVVNGYMYGFYNDDEFECLGKLKAIAIISEEHFIKASTIEVDKKSITGIAFGPNILYLRDDKDRDYLRNFKDHRFDEIVYPEEINYFYE